MKLQSFNCPNCKAPLEPIKDARFMFCPYCGNKIVIDDIDYYREDSKTHREQIRADMALIIFLVCIASLFLLIILALIGAALGY